MGISCFSLTNSPFSLPPVILLFLEGLYLPQSTWSRWGYQSQPPCSNQGLDRCSSDQSEKCLSTWKQWLAQDECPSYQSEKYLLIWTQWLVQDGYWSMEDQSVFSVLSYEEAEKGNVGRRIHFTFRFRAIKSQAWGCWGECILFSLFLIPYEEEPWCTEGNKEKRWVGRGKVPNTQIVPWIHLCLKLTLDFRVTWITSFHFFLLKLVWDEFLIITIKREDDSYRMPRKLPGAVRSKPNSWKMGSLFEVYLLNFFC